MRTKIAIALGIVYVVWGSTYLAIAVADRTLPPLLMLAVRFGLAGGLLYAWSFWRGDVAAARLGRREWTAAAVVGGLLLFVDTGGIAWAEQRVASGLTALLIATVPLFAAILDRTFFGIRLSLGALAGIAAGLLGVALLVGQSAHVDPVGAAVILVGALSWAAGSAYGRVAPLPEAPFLSAAMQMLCAAALLGVAGAAMGEIGRVHPAAISAGSLGAFAFLVVFGSIVAFTAYSWLLRSGASSVLVSTYAYVNPAVAVLLGWAFAGEAVGGRELAAGAIVVVSVGMLILARTPHEDAETTTEAADPGVQHRSRTGTIPTAAHTAARRPPSHRTLSRVVAALPWQHEHLRSPHTPPPQRRPGARARRDRARAARARRADVRAAAESRSR